MQRQRARPCLFPQLVAFITLYIADIRHYNLSFLGYFVTSFPAASRYPWISTLSPYPAMLFSLYDPLFWRHIKASSFALQNGYP